MMKKITTAILFISQAMAASPTPEQFMDSLSGDIPLINLSLLGSHDAGTYGLDPSLGISPDEYGSALYTIGNMPLFGSIIDAAFIQAWSRTQVSDITGQLNNGVRYFDLRLTLCLDGSYRICHGLFGPLLEDVLSEFNAFLESHPKEIVLLDFQLLYNLTGGDLTAEQQGDIITTIQQSLGGKIAPSSYGSGVTLGQMWQNNNQAIIFWTDYTVSGNYPGLVWDRQMFLNSTWYNQTDWSTLESDLNQGIANRQGGIFFVNQAILTPSASMIFLNLCSNLLNIGEGADESAMTWWQQMAAAGTAGSILMLDNTDSTYQEAFQISMAYNQGL